MSLVISGSVVAQHNLHNRLPVQLSAFYLYVKDEQAAGFPVVFGCVFQKRLNDQGRHPVRKQCFVNLCIQDKRADTVQQNDIVIVVYLRQLRL